MKPSCKSATFERPRHPPPGCAPRRAVVKPHGHAAARTRKVERSAHYDAVIAREFGEYSTFFIALSHGSDQKTRNLRNSLIRFVN